MVLGCTSSVGQSSTDVKYVPFIENGLWGLATWEGDVIFEPKWEKVLTERVQSMHELSLFSFLNTGEGIYIVHAPSKTIHGPYDQVNRTWINGMTCRKGQKKGFVNSEGELAIPMEYKDIYTNKFTNHIILMKDDGSQAITTLKSEVPEKFPYRRLGSIYFHDEKTTGFLGTLNGKWGLLDSKIEVVIPFDYDEIQKLGNRNRPLYLMCSKKDAENQLQATIVNQDGTELFTTTTTKIKAHNIHLLSLYVNNKGWTLVDQSGKLVSNEYFSRIEWLPNRDTDAPQILKTVTTLDKKIYFDKNGEELPIKEAEAIIENYMNGPQLNGLSIVENKDKLKGVVSENGDTVVDVLYNHVKFVGECITVSNYTSVGNVDAKLFDKKGKLLIHSAMNIKRIYLDYSSESYPLIQIKSSKGTHLRNLDGSDILNTPYQIAIPETIRDDKTGDFIPVIKVKVNEKWGYTDIEGTQIVAPVYDTITPLIGIKLFIVEHEGKKVVVNSDGKKYTSKE